MPIYIFPLPYVCKSEPVYKLFLYPKPHYVVISFNLHRLYTLYCCQMEMYPVNLRLLAGLWNTESQSKENLKMCFQPHVWKEKRM